MHPSPRYVSKVVIPVNKSGGAQPRTPVHWRAATNVS
jgi:hypothetical protein